MSSSHCILWEDRNRSRHTISFRRAKVVKHTFITVEDDMSPLGVRRCKSDSVIKVLFDEDKVSSTGVHWPRRATDSDWNWQKLPSWDDCGFVLDLAPMDG